MKTINSYENKQALVLGMAKSGYAAAKLLLHLRAKVTVNDRSSLIDNPNARELEALGVRIVDKEHPPELVSEATDVVVKNPGIPYTNPLIVKALALNIPVITEVELASEISDADFVGITGSNGKTTTTMLVGDLLAGSSYQPIVAGNIGTALCDVVRDAAKDNLIVAELSSFQLLGVRSFHPRVAVFLNLFDAHLDYHGSIEAYGQAKAKITENQTVNDWIVYNADDSRVKMLIQESSACKLPFSINQKVDGAYLHNETLYYKGTAIMRKDALAMPKGDHNVANALAAIAVAKIYNVEDSYISQVLQDFSGVPHRLQYVTTIHDRAFYNDSKATNILATTKALGAFQQPVILLAGGLDRGNSFDELIPFLKGVKAVLTFGETKQKIAQAAKMAGVKTVIMVDNAEEAVPTAYDLSEAGDVILLSPACASWDQYSSFEERGDMFIKMVHTLK